MKIIELDIVNSEIYTEEDWLIIIIDKMEKRVIYVTTSTSHPAAQLEREIIKGNLQKDILESDSLKLYAFPLSEGVNRQIVKKLFIHELDDLNVNEDGHMEDITLNAEIWEQHVNVAKSLSQQIQQILQK